MWSKREYTMNCINSWNIMYIGKWNFHFEILDIIIFNAVKRTRCKLFLYSSLHLELYTIKLYSNFVLLHCRIAIHFSNLLIISESHVTGISRIGKTVANLNNDTLWQLHSFPSS